MELADAGLILLILILLSTGVVLSFKRYASTSINSKTQNDIKLKKRNLVPLFSALAIILSVILYSQYYKYESSDSRKSDISILSKNFKDQDLTKLNASERSKVLDSLKKYKKELLTLISKRTKEEYIIGKRDSILLKAKMRKILVEQAQNNLLIINLDSNRLIAQKQTIRVSPIGFKEQKQHEDQVKLLAVTIVAGLLLVLVGLLISNVKQKAKTNDQLSMLNAEVNRQKDNLDRINHHLEEIIDARTKGLQMKNKKLTETVNNLIFQITKPFYDFKGIAELKKDELITLDDTFKVMRSSLEEIDDFISDLREDVNKAQSHL